MAVYTVGYDLNKPGQHYHALLSAIKNYGVGNYIEPLKSQWYISTSQTCEQVFNYLYQFVDTNDYLIVHEVKYNYYGNLENEYHDWLRSHLN